MPLSNAAMEGISANGLKWKYNGPRLKFANTILADLVDNGIEDEAAAQRLTDASHKIAAAIKSWLGGITNTDIVEDFERRHDMDIDFIEYIDVVGEVKAGIYDDPQEVLNEINYIMNNIYDTFDYHRILVH